MGVCGFRGFRDGRKKIREGHCPRCGPDRFGDIVAEHRETFSDDINGIWGRTDYRIIRCRGCGEVYYQSAEIFSEDVNYEWDEEAKEHRPYTPERVSHWPVPTKRAAPQWTGALQFSYDRLSNLLDDVYGCLNAGLPIPAVIAVRTTFDAASELLEVDPAISFAEKLVALQAQGHIGRGECQALEVLTDAGGAAAHRGWKPKAAQLDTIISILEAFLHRTFVLTAEAAALKADIPPKPPRKKIGK